MTRRDAVVYAVGIVATAGLLLLLLVMVTGATS